MKYRSWRIDQSYQRSVALCECAKQDSLSLCFVVRRKIRSHNCLCAWNVYRWKKSVSIDIWLDTPVVQPISTPHNAHGTANFRSKREWHLVLKVAEKTVFLISSLFSLARSHICSSASSFIPWGEQTTNHARWRSGLSLVCPKRVHALIVTVSVHPLSLIIIPVESMHLFRSLIEQVCDQTPEKLTGGSTMMTSCPFLSLSLLTLCSPPHWSHRSVKQPGCRQRFFEVQKNTSRARETLGVDMWKKQHWSMLYN